MEAGILLSLGSNMPGERVRHLFRALHMLAAEKGCSVERVSSLYLTEPVGLKGAPEFINAAAEVASGLSPDRLLAACQDIERRLGRVRGCAETVRSIDIDIALFRVVTSRGADLRIPHPRMHLRNFVLIPLDEISPASIHPEFGTTINRLRRQCPDRHAVRKV